MAGQALYPRTLAVLAAAGLGTAVPVAHPQAFEVDGYRAGMTLAEVRRIAGALLPAGSAAGESETHYVARAADGSPNGNIVFIFCRDRLTGYQLGLRGPPAFAEAVAAETRRRGPGTYRAEHIAMPDGPLGALRFDWNDGADRLVLTALMGDRRFSATRRWEVRTTPCR